MNKITHEGQEYEVLTLDRISEITHAKLAGGKVVGVELRSYDSIKDQLWMHHDGAQYGVFTTLLADLGIQPLKLLPKKPVEFVATFAFTGAAWRPLHCLTDGLSMQGREQKKFRCVEVTE